MILQTPKVQAKMLCNFFYIDFLGLYYATDKVLKLFYTGMCMHLLD